MRSEIATTTTTAAAGARDGRAAAVLALALCVALYVLAVAVFPSTGDQDAAIHAIYARFPNHPARYLSAYARPAFAVPYLLPALIGYGAMRATTVAVCAAVAWLTYLTARRVGLARPWLAVPFVLLQPALYVVGVDTMTEPTFALLLAAGLWACAAARPALAAALWSFLPLARPEGPFVIAVVAALWLPAALRAPRRWLPRLALLGLGMATWELACIVVTHDPRFIQETFSWQSGAYPWRGTWYHFLARWPHIVGWGLLPLWLAGVVAAAAANQSGGGVARAAARAAVLRLALAATGVLLVTHTYLYMAGMMASTGFDRYFATLAPLTALLAVAGAERAARLLRERGRARLAAPLLGVLLAAEALHAWVRLDANAIAHTGAEARRGVALAAARAAGGDLRARPFVSADYFGFVFADVDRPGDLMAVGVRDSSLRAIERLPAGTVVLWDDTIGDWWFHLAVEDFTARGFRVLADRRTELGSPLAPLYVRPGSRRWTGRWVLSVFGNGLWPTRPFRQTLLVRAPAAASPVAPASP